MGIELAFCEEKIAHPFPSMWQRFKAVWIPRLFIAAMLPSVGMVVALIFFPNSQIAKCPLIPLQPAPQLVLDGQLFTLENMQVLIPPLGELKLIFLGIVFDVSSAAHFYGPEAAYGPLAAGVDATRALCLSTLDDLGDGNIADLPKGTIAGKLRQWAIFFLNKYPQVGVVEGVYFSKHAKPTQTWLELVQLIQKAAGSNTPDSPPSPMVTIEPCQERGGQVTCARENLVPKILRSRGVPRCACVEEEAIFAHRTAEFVVVHFERCDERVCWPRNDEL